MTSIRVRRILMGAIAILAIWPLTLASAAPARPTGPLPELVLQNGHTDVVTAVAFSPDGRSVATASDDEMAKVWDVASGRVRVTLSGHADVTNGSRGRPTSPAWPSSRTAAAWPPQAGIARRGSGIWAPAARWTG